MNDVIESSKEIVLVQNALAEFDSIEAGLALLEKNYKNAVYEVDTAMGMSHAKAARAAIRDPRYKCEKARKAGKSRLLELGRYLDGQATRITNALMSLESPICDQIDAEEARKEAEKQAIAAAEAKRVADIQARIDAMRNAVTGLAGYPPELLNEEIAEVERIAVDESFAEFQQAASDVKAATLGRLRELLAGAVAQEAEKARIREERAELARLRAEQEERDRVAREAQAAERAENERITAQRRAQFEEQGRAERSALEAEARRLAQERAELEALRAPPPAPVIDSKSHYHRSRGEIVSIVADYYDTSHADALKLLRSIDWDA
jgi:colicin import membrane protein